MSTVLLWGYVAAMAAGVALFLSWGRDPRGVPRVEYLIAAAIPLWSGAWYAVMALGGGQVQVAGQTTYWARYADWLVSTPLLLLALSLTAMHALPRKRWGLVAALIAADVVMITAGLVADLQESSTARYAFYAVGVAALLTVLALVAGPLRRTARLQPPEMAEVHREASVLLAVLWTGYPVIWLLGPSGLGLFGQLADTALFVLLPIASKVGWSVVDLTRLRGLAERDVLTVA
jgi:bacteriorhodopsin